MGLGVGQLVTVLTVIALVASLSRKTHARSRFQNLKVDPTERTRHATSQFPQGARDWFFLAALFLVFVSIAATASLVVFSGKPFFADTEGMLAQGRLFARGMLKGTSTEFLPGTGFIVHRANEWFSIYSPGHPLMLALGSLFGNKEFLVNPILGGLSATLMVALAYKRYGKAVSCSTALLFCVSPWVVFTSAEFLAHATTLFFITLALYSITSWEDGRKGAWMWALAFACFGLVITRPYTGIALLAPLPFYLYSQGIALRHLMRALFGVASGAAVVLAHNYALTGDAFLSPYELLLGTGHGPGFGDRGPTRGYFDLWTGLEYLFLNLRSISTWLFVWPIPSLSLFVLALLTTRIRALEALYLGCVVSLCAAYTAYWDFKNELLGPRFLYESVGILILFSAIGLVRLIDLANTRYSRIALGVCFVGCVAFSVWMCAFSLAPDFMAR
jgi:4-amino-4-deoxy-L-arabinose transferase-like glycosyltransferase